MSARLDEIEYRLASPMVTYKENATEDAPALVAALRTVLDLADKWEHGATRWADPLPVPPEVEQVRHAIDAALGGER